MIYLHLKATNDENGNPQRCFLVLDAEGDVLDVLDEGYSGDDVRRKYPEAKQGPAVRVSVSEYASWVEVAS
jgi:hypothetical protein